MVLVIAGGVGAQSKSLYSSLPRVHSAPSNMGQSLPSAPIYLPGNMSYSDITSFAVSSPVAPPSNINFGSLFQAPPTVPELRPPISNKRRATGQVLSWRNSATQQAQLWSPQSAPNQPYMSQPQPVSTWLNYSAGPQISTTRDGEEEKTSSHSLCAEPRCVSSRKRKRQFAELHTSFAPSRDQSGAQITDADRTSVGWTRQNADQFALHFSAIDNPTYLSSSLDRLDDISWDESYIQDFEPLADDAAIDMQDAVGIQKPQTSDINASQRISSHLVSLYADQRDERLGSTHIPLSKPEMDITKPSTEDRGLVRLIDHKADATFGLVDLLQQNPPHLATKHTVDKTQSLSISTTLRKPSRDFYGTLDETEVPQNNLAALRQAVQAPSLGGRTSIPATSQSSQRSGRPLSGGVPSRTNLSYSVTPSRLGPRDARASAMQSAIPSRTNGYNPSQTPKPSDSRSYNGTPIPPIHPPTVYQSAAIERSRLPQQGQLANGYSYSAGAGQRPVNDSPASMKQPEPVYRLQLGQRLPKWEESQELQSQANGLTPRSAVQNPDFRRTLALLKQETAMAQRTAHLKKSPERTQALA